MNIEVPLKMMTELAESQESGMRATTQGNE
jgi:hypothetical protein